MSADRQVLIVTGGGRGIGAATCRLAASRGIAEHPALTAINAFKAIIEVPECLPHK